MADEKQNTYIIPMKVLKFGGTSMATAQSIKRVAEIIKKESDCVVVVSAPGKRFTGDIKVTDLLIDSYKAYLDYGRCDIRFKEVAKRFEELSTELGVTSLSPLLTDVRNEINAGKSIGYASGRGEFLSAKLLSEYTGLEFVDAIGLIKFDSYGGIDYESTFRHVIKRIKGLGSCVVPGFYGVLPNGIIRALDRGGSDVTGSLIAAALEAEAYENWTDVDGFYFSDPQLTSAPKSIPNLSAREMKLLSLMGARVLHYDSIKPLEKSKIPIIIKNTFNPDFKGSVVSDSFGQKTVTGVALRQRMILWRLPQSRKELFTRFMEDRGKLFFPLPAGEEKTVISRECTAEEIEDIKESFGVTQSKEISVITAVGENIKKSAVKVLKRLVSIQTDFEFLIYDGELAVYMGVNPNEANASYLKICDALDF